MNLSVRKEGLEGRKESGKCCNYINLKTTTTTIFSIAKKEVYGKSTRQNISYKIIHLQ